jgi:hypothetical protein
LVRDRINPSLYKPAVRSFILSQIGHYLRLVFRQLIGDNPNCHQN